MRIRTTLTAALGAGMLALTMAGCGGLPEIPGMSICEKGTFTHGYSGPGAKPDEGPTADKEIKKSFYIDTTEVTNKEYKKFMDAKKHPAPTTWHGDTYPQGQDDLPVTGVTYDDAKAYADWAGKRIPDAIEWEYAARGPDSKLYPWGGNWEKGRCNNFEEGKGGPVKVGEYANGKSWCGAVDMAGNVWEWTSTPTKDDPNVMIIKGGSFAPLEDHPRASINGRLPRDKSNDKTGFRCAKDPE